MRIVDSRRLTGPNLLLDGPGAHLDVDLHGLEPGRAVERWRSEARLLLEAVGWSDATVATRVHARGASLAFTAPIDALYAATEVNEAAWHAVVAALGGDELLGVERGHGHADTLEDLEADGDDGAPPFDVVVERLRATIAAERNPLLLELASAARARGVTLLTDDKRISLGLGRRSRSWPIEETASLQAGPPWEELDDIPVALVTGTNGKSTTVRLLAAMARAAGIISGVTSTDHVTIGDEVVAEGDYSGPNGARTVLRDRRVEMAMLEVARGGLLRRGLAVPRAAAALVTNVANDHLGEFGIFDLAALADAKMVVAKAIGDRGRVVLNADDPLLVERGARLAVPVLWFTLDAAHPMVTRHVARGGEAALLEDGALVLARGSARDVVAAVSEIPIALGGAARHNVANALGAIGVASALGLPLAAMRAGLMGFTGSPAENPGRANQWDLNGVRVIVDFAHNPHGLEALAHMMLALPGTRRGIVIGQAGDREDDAIRAFARAAWAMRPDRVFIKEMDSYRRGREPGVIPALIEAELRAAGSAPDATERHADELGAVRAALAWARSGDLLLLTSHAERDAVIELVGRLHAQGWAPGRPLDSDATATP